MKEKGQRQAKPKSPLPDQGGAGMISFASDYTTGAHPELLRRLIETNTDAQPGKEAMQPIKNAARGGAGYAVQASAGCGVAASDGISR